MKLNRFKIASPDEEASCENCGSSRYVGDYAVETADQSHFYCDEPCANQHADAMTRFV